MAEIISKSLKEEIILKSLKKHNVAEKLSLPPVI